MTRIAAKLVYALVLFSLVVQSRADAQILRNCRLRPAIHAPLRPAQAQKSAAGSEVSIPETSVPEIPEPQVPVAEVPEPKSPLPDVPANDAPVPDVPANDAPAPDVPTTEPPVAEPPAAESPVAESTPLVKKSNPAAISQQAKKVVREPVFSGPKIPSGARITLFANFLGDQAGCVLLDFAGTAAECEVIDWRESSVTVQMPRWGLREPKAAQLRIVHADGRLAEQFNFLLVAAPDIVIHRESLPIPSPVGSAGRPAVYAAP